MKIHQQDNIIKNITQVALKIKSKIRNLYILCKFIYSKVKNILSEL